MCRLLLHWGKQEFNATELLITAGNALLKQSRKDNTGRPNQDGWGIVFERAGHWEIHKSTAPAFEDKDFEYLARQINSTFMLAHVRRRSQGPVSLENTHPFLIDEWAFMHNGNIPNLERIKKILSEKLPYSEALPCKGTTDSEWLFRYFYTQFKNNPDCPPECILEIIRAIVKHIVQETPEEDYNMLALNFVLTNGKVIFAFRRNRPLHYLDYEEGIILASEIIDDKDGWKELPEDHYLLAYSPTEFEIIPQNYSQKTVEQTFSQLK
ncbi:MAG: class II glutamine amidotransferase [Calditrichia bacterium]